MDWKDSNESVHTGISFVAVTALKGSYTVLRKSLWKSQHFTDGVNSNDNKYSLTLLYQNQIDNLKVFTTTTKLVFINIIPFQFVWYLFGKNTVC